jgi:hypothetical protein
VPAAPLCAPGAGLHTGATTRAPRPLCSPAWLLRQAAAWLDTMGCMGSKGTEVDAAIPPSPVTPASPSSDAAVAAESAPAPEAKGIEGKTKVEVVAQLRKWECPQGHLFDALAPGENAAFTCALCNSELLQGSAVQHCVVCEFRVCLPCMTETSSYFADVAKP